MKDTRIIVFSDTHGNSMAMNKIFTDNEALNHFIFLGDGERELAKIKEIYPRKTIISAAGNCDYRSASPDSGIFEVEGVKIFYTHGHNWEVKYSLTRILIEAKNEGASVALFGHTHCRSLDYQDGIYLLNPGSAAYPRDGDKPSYAFIDITSKGIFCSHVDL